MWNKRINSAVTAATAVLATLFCAPLQAVLMLAPDADGYQMIDSAERFGPEYAYVDISETGALLSLTDDGSAEIRLPFRFEFYGVEYSTAHVSANGYISFGASDNNYNCDPGIPNCLPMTIPQPANTPGWQSGPFIAPWFDDLDPEAGGAVYFEVRGVAPNRRAVVQWRTAHHDDHSAKFEFQVVLQQSSNRILFQYRETNATNSALSNGKSASVGIQGRDNAGIGYSAAEARLTNNLAIGFAPVKYGYIGIPDPPQGQSGVPGEVVPYEVMVFNGKDVATDFKVELLPGSRWQVVELPATTGLIPPGQSKALAIKVKVPESGSAAMADEIVSLKITDKVVTTTTSSGSGGGSTTTANNEVVPGTTTTTVKEIMSFVNLTARCLPAPCFQQDSDGDGVADGSEAASTVDNSSKVDGFEALSGALLNIDVTGGALHGFSVAEAVAGPAGKEFAEGVIDYRIIPSRVAESVTLTLTPPTPWSSQLELYTVDSAGKFTLVDAKKWKPQDQTTPSAAVSTSHSVITLTLVDGGNLDADGVSNGVIVNRLALGEPESSQAGGAPGQGSSGALFGELLLLVLLGGWRYAASIKL